jgi:CPA1 family monovalent cation:H+ antiporter
VHLGSHATRGGDGRHAAHNDIHRRALQAAREAVLSMRNQDEIGDDAFHQMEEELDWLDMAGGRNED